MLLKQSLHVVVQERVRQRKMPRQVGADTAANMHCQIDCTAVSVVQDISAAHGATATAASVSSGVASAGLTTAANTATIHQRWMKSRCTEPSLPQ